MSNILIVIFFALLGGLISLIGGVLLMAKQSWVKPFARYATPFAAGALLAAAFIALLPEALTGCVDPTKILIWTLAGLLFFFLLETAIHWLHNHNARMKKKVNKIHPVIPMLIAGNTIHNVIDGIAIAAGFLVSPAAGIVVTLVVAAHEIPHKIGNFGLMLGKGLSRKNVITINALIVLVATTAAAIFYTIGLTTDISLAPLLGVVAGFFIYIATANIIPSMHDEKVKSEVVKKAGLLIGGVVLVGFLITTLHGMIDEHGGHDHGEESSQHVHEHDEECDHESTSQSPNEGHKHDEEAHDHHE
ncbi:ZIP family metal transporter [Candidatus Saccharibacteria bacterium]|nr:ZIP family metal transporter [Candidatus Saccharibacteria bacterium]